MLPEKVPDLTHSDPRRSLGDSIYDFSGATIKGEPANACLMHGMP